MAIIIRQERITNFIMTARYTELSVAVITAVKRPCFQAELLSELLSMARIETVDWLSEILGIPNKQ